MGSLIRLPLLLLALLLSGCAAKNSLRPKGLSPAPTTQEVLDAQLRPRRIAVVVGINEYVDPAFPNLQFAAADANAMADRLLSPDQGGFDQVVRLVLPAQTTREAVLDGLRRATLALRPEDTLVVYISGHGSRVPDAERWRRFLLTRDSQAGDLEQTAVDLSALERWFSTLRPERKALILDACFSGDGKSVVRPGAPTMSPGLANAPTPSELAGGELHLHATTAGRPSLEDDRLGHGVYTHFFLEAMSWDRGVADIDRDGVITAWEAHDYARGRTMEWTKNVQVPEAILRVVGKADLVLVGDPDRRSQAQSVLYLYGTESPLNDAQLLIDGQPRGGFPGAHIVRPGVRTITMTDAETGEVLADGRVRLKPGFAYEAQSLSLRTMGSAHAIGIAATSVHSPVLTSLGSGPSLGVELRASLRQRRRPAPGLTLLGSVGLSGARGSYGLRSVATGHAALGWSDDVGRLRLMASVGSSMLVVPTTGNAANGTLSQGWYLVSFGPELGIGWWVRRPLSLMLGVRPHMGAASLTPRSPVRAVGHTTITLGLERSW